MLNMHRVFPVATLFILGAPSLPTTSLAQDASREQCTCDIPDTERRTGAQVVNAASCILEPRYPWCDIYLPTLEDSSDHDKLVTKLTGIPDGSANDLVELLGGLLREYAEATAQSQPELSARRAADAKNIERLMPDAYGVISQCIVYFSKEQPRSAENDFVECSVGRFSGWLRIEFQVDGREYIFLFSPNGEVLQERNGERP